MRKKLVFAVPLAGLLLLGGCGGKVSIKDETLRLSLGEEYTISVDSPEDGELTFSSLDPNIVSVDENGTVKALGNGITVITVKSGSDFDNVAVVAGNGVAQYVDENGNVVSSLSPSLAEDAVISGESDITALSISVVGGGSKDVTISTDRTYELKIDKTPSDSSDKIALKIADGSIASINGTTLVGLSKGKTVLTATAPNGVSAEMVVRVK